MKLRVAARLEPQPIEAVRLKYETHAVPLALIASTCSDSHEPKPILFGVMRPGCSTADSVHANYLSYKLEKSETRAQNCTIIEPIHQATEVKTQSSAFRSDEKRES